MKLLTIAPKYLFKKHSSILVFLVGILSAPTILADPDLQKKTDETIGGTMNETAIAERNLALGEKFLAENLKKPGIHKLESGLQYKIIHEGKGESPGPTDFVTVNYRGTLINGTEFDSSYARNMPATFAVNAVIPGWTEALQLMKPGAKWTVYIPAHLAYGSRGVGRLIGPNATLIFDIELLSVKTEDLVGFPDEYDDDDG